MDDFIVAGRLSDRVTAHIKVPLRRDTCMTSSSEDAGVAAAAAGGGTLSPQRVFRLRGAASVMEETCTTVSLCPGKLQLVNGREASSSLRRSVTELQCILDLLQRIKPNRESDVERF